MSGPPRLLATSHEPLLPAVPPIARLGVPRARRAASIAGAPAPGDRLAGAAGPPARTRKALLDPARPTDPGPTPVSVRIGPGLRTPIDRCCVRAMRCCVPDSPEARRGSEGLCPA